MTNEQTQELKALMCRGCKMRLPEIEGHHQWPEGKYSCTANPAVIEWVEKQLTAVELERFDTNAAYGAAIRDHKQAIAAAEEATVEAQREADLSSLKEQSVMVARLGNEMIAAAIAAAYGKLQRSPLIKTPGNLATFEAEIRRQDRERVLPLLKLIDEACPQLYRCEYGSPEMRHVEPSDWDDIATTARKLLAELTAPPTTESEDK